MVFHILVYQSFENMIYIMWKNIFQEARNEMQMLSKEINNLLKCVFPFSLFVLVVNIQAKGEAYIHSDIL